MGTSPIPVGKWFHQKNGWKIHYHETGKFDPKKPTVYFLHGGGPGASGYSNFAANMQEFAKAGYHCIAPDVLGFGLSDKPEDALYYATTHVQMMREMLAAMGVEKIVPVGNSLGGGIAFLYAMAYPEATEKLIVMGPGGVQDPRIIIPNSPGLQAMYKYTTEAPTDEKSYRDLLLNLVYDPAMITEEVVAMRFPIRLSQPMKLYETLQTPWYLKNQLRHDLKCPLLAFWGKQDRFLPYTHADLVKDAIPEARTVVADKTGHWFMIEQAEQFNAECIDFLKS